MKKLKQLLVLVSLLLISVGCSKEIKTEELNADINKQMDSNVQDKIVQADVRDEESLYEFISIAHPGKFTRDDFNAWVFNYLDINLDDIEDVVITGTRGDGHLENAIFILAKNESFELVSSDVVLGKYKTEVSMDQEFIIFIREYGGTGAITEDESIYVYDDAKILDTGAELTLKNLGPTSQDPNWKNKYGEITGTNLYDFTFIIYEEDSETLVRTPITKKHFQYNKKTKKYEIEEETIELDNQSGDNIQLLEELSPGDKVGNFTLNKESEFGGDSVIIVLDGPGTVEGSIYYENGEYYEGYVLEIEGTNILKESIKVTLYENELPGYEYQFNPNFLWLTNDSSFFSTDQARALKDGKKIQGKFVIKQIRHYAKLNSEGGTGCELLKLEDVRIIE